VKIWELIEAQPSTSLARIAREGRLARDCGSGAKRVALSWVDEAALALLPGRQLSQNGDPYPAGGAHPEAGVSRAHRQTQVDGQQSRLRGEAPPHPLAPRDPVTAEQLPNVCSKACIGFSLTASLR
jgi:hypothetical protein